MSPKLKKIVRIAAAIIFILLAIGIVTGRIGLESDGTLNFHPDDESDQSGLVLIDNGQNGDDGIDEDPVQSGTQTEDPGDGDQQTDVPEQEKEDEPSEPEPEKPAVDRDGYYTSKEDVALYIHTYGCLPDNFVTKKEAQNAGWPGGGLDDYFYGCSIGGDRFGNYEGLLPKAKGRTYYECDIDTMHAKSRGAKRIVFSSDGLVYYTEDHYEHFELLYGEE